MENMNAKYDALRQAVTAETAAKGKHEKAKESASGCHKEFVEFLRDIKGKKTKADIKEGMRGICYEMAGKTRKPWPKEEDGIKFVGYKKAMAAGCKDADVYNAFAKHCDTFLNDDGTYKTKEQKADEKRKIRVAAAEELEKTKTQQAQQMEEKLADAAGNVSLDTLIEVLKEKHGATVEETENGFMVIKVCRVIG